MISFFEALINLVNISLLRDFIHNSLRKINFTKFIWLMFLSIFMEKIG